MMPKCYADMQHPLATVTRIFHQAQTYLLTTFLTPTCWSDTNSLTGRALMSSRHRETPSVSSLGLENPTSWLTTDGVLWARRIPRLKNSCNDGEGRGGVQVLLYCGQWWYLTCDCQQLWTLLPLMTLCWPPMPMTLCASLTTHIHAAQGRFPSMCMSGSGDHWSVSRGCSYYTELDGKELSCNNDLIGLQPATNHNHVCQKCHGYQAPVASLAPDFCNRGVCSHNIESEALSTELWVRQYNIRRKMTKWASRWIRNSFHDNWQNMSWKEKCWQCHWS